MMKMLIPLLLLSCLMISCSDSNEAASTEWQALELVDVRTQESFTLDQFRGKVVVVEAMAVWCPQCTTQQQMIAAAQSEIEEEIVVVSLDIDSNENEDVLRQHAEWQGWDWRFAISSPELSQMLQAQYGAQILAPTSTPVLIIAPDGTTELTPFGIKGWEELITMIEAFQN